MDNLTISSYQSLIHESIKPTLFTYRVVQYKNYYAFISMYEGTCICSIITPELMLLYFDAIEFDSINERFIRNIEEFINFRIKSIN